MPENFLWYDLETFGRNPRNSRISQFAAIRTDSDLNPIGEPVSLFCRPADDFLPEPEAALITGITPQHALAAGLCEAEFMAVLQEQFSPPGTCALGYNSIRFDDEFIRFGLYRNFFDAYEREYAGGNSRWDLLDVMRMFYAMRPDGLQWPLREDGLPSFKLEDLAKANDCFEGEAHEALSDVRSLINLARRAKTAQPRLWDYALKLRDKEFVAGIIAPYKRQAVLHVSGQFSAERACSALMLPLMPHPLIKNRVIAVELAPEALKLLDYTPVEIASNIFTKRSLLPEGESRIGIKEIQHNHCPVVIALQSLSEAELSRWSIDAKRLKLDIASAEAVHSELLAHSDIITDKLAKVFSRPRSSEPADPDAALYDGFIERTDKLKFGKARSSKGRDPLVFVDTRLSELYFRYKARNWPESLTGGESIQWRDFRKSRLTPEALADYSQQCLTLAEAHPDKARVIRALIDWAEQISPAKV
jgi:exodeoxyribonuclease-1